MTTPEKSNDWVGQVVDKYKLVRCIGCGGFGEVYEAKHTLVGKRFAVKLLHPQLADNDIIVQRMLREAQAAAAIGHANIVDTFDFGITTDNVIYLVMEYLEGSSFDELIHDHETLDLGFVAGVMLQVLSALAAAHDANIVHRDLKPENIFIARTRGGGEEVRLLDFGISKVTSLDAESLQLTRTGSVLGSPYYMSPEQATGAGDVDGRADLWAVGIVIYQALTGDFPFSGENYNQLMFRIATKGYTRLRALRPDLPVELDALVDRALQKIPGDRYQNAEEMANALRPFGSADGMPKTATTLGDPVGHVEANNDGGGHAVSQEPSFSEQLTSVEYPVLSPITPDEIPVDETAFYGDSGGLFRSPSTSKQAGRADHLHGRGISGSSETVAPGQMVGRQSAISRNGLSRPVKIAIGAGTAGLALVTAVILFFTMGGDGSKHSGDGNSPARQATASVGPDASGMERQMVVVMSILSRPRQSPFLDAAVQRSGAMFAEPRKMIVRLKGLPRWARVRLDGKLTDVRFSVNADGRRRKLLVNAPGYYVFKTTFNAVGKEKTIMIRMVRVRRRHRPRSARPVRPRDDTGIIVRPMY